MLYPRVTPPLNIYPNCHELHQNASSPCLFIKYEIIAGSKTAHFSFAYLASKRICLAKCPINFHLYNPEWDIISWRRRAVTNV